MRNGQGIFWPTGLREPLGCTGLLDMLVAARDAVEFAEGLASEAFALDRRTQLSIVKLIEIVGEAASGIDPEMRRLHVEMPWQDIDSISTSTCRPITSCRD